MTTAPETKDAAPAAPAIPDVWVPPSRSGPDRYPRFGVLFVGTFIVAALVDFIFHGGLKILPKLFGPQRGEALVAWQITVLPPAEQRLLVTVGRQAKAVGCVGRTPSVDPGEACRGALAVAAQKIDFVVAELSRQGHSQDLPAVQELVGRASLLAWHARIVATDTQRLIVDPKTMEEVVDKQKQVYGDALTLGEEIDQVLDLENPGWGPEPVHEEKPAPPVKDHAPIAPPPPSPVARLGDGGPSSAPAVATTRNPASLIPAASRATDAGPPRPTESTDAGPSWFSTLFGGSTDAGAADAALPSWDAGRSRPDAGRRAVDAGVLDAGLVKEAGNTEEEDDDGGEEEHLRPYTTDFPARFSDGGLDLRPDAGWQPVDTASLADHLDKSLFEALSVLENAGHNPDLIPDAVAQAKAGLFDNKYYLYSYKKAPRTASAQTEAELFATKVDTEQTLLLKIANELLARAVPGDPANFAVADALVKKAQKNIPDIHRLAGTAR